MPFPDFLTSWLSTYKYVVIFLVALVEGPIIMTISGFFFKLGYFTFWPLYLTLMAGDLAADILWYGVGRYAAHPFIKKYGYFFSVSDELLHKTEALVKRHSNKILFLSKITMGLGFALVILIAAGMARVPFRKYLAFNIAGQFIWTGFLLAIGYFFGNLYLVINEGLRTAALIAFLVILIGAVHGISRYLRKRTAQNNP